VKQLDVTYPKHLLNERKNQRRTREALQIIDQEIMMPTQDVCAIEMEICPSHKHDFFTLPGLRDSVLVLEIGEQPLCVSVWKQRNFLLYDQKQKSPR